ncbi:hypothetical protein EDD16DRAFT_135637 [Pisolithus croceorrhizus]|nr:hypothetical protein EDD16DRAFT_135637 [Pisolithus croceorrhizus]
MNYSTITGQTGLEPSSCKKQRLSYDVSSSDFGSESLTDQDSPDIRSYQPLYDEVDLEVALRERLLSTIEGRIQWATLLLNSLESHEETEAPLPATEVDEFQQAALDALDALEVPSSIIFETATPEEPETSPRSFSPLVSAPPPPPPPQRTSKTRASRVPKLSQPKKLLYIRLSSGDTEANQLAILACPTCSRTQFTTLQGLLNHARLAHGIEWASHDACITACAVPVTPDDNAYKTYQQEGLEVPWGGNVVGLRRLFERAVGVEGQFVSPPDAEFTPQDAATIPSTLLSRTLGLHADSPSLAPFLGRAPRRRCIHVHNEEQDVDIISIDEHPSQQATMPSVSTERRRPQFRMNYLHRSVARPELDGTIELETNATAKTEAADAAGFLPNTLASRFHITARVRVEDRSLYLTKDRQTKLDSPHQYRWMIAVTAPSYALPLASYLTRVTVFPPAVVSPVPLTVDKQPFAVIGTANGPFLAKVFLEWIGGGKLEIEHWVDLDPSKSATSVLGSDEMIDVEVDRNVTLLSVSNGAPPPLPSLDRQLGPDSFTAHPGLPGGQASIGPNEFPHEQILRSLLPRAPMTAKDVKPRSNIRVPYKLVPSPGHLLALMPGKRKAIEWARARTLHGLYAECAATTSASSHIPLTVGDVYAWLEDTALFPRPTSLAMPLIEVKKKAKEKEGTPVVGEFPCPVCGIKKRLHPGYEAKLEEGAHEWTCLVVPRHDQEHLGKFSLVDSSVAFAPRGELERVLYGPRSPTGSENVMQGSNIAPYMFPAFRCSPRDLITLSPPELILAIQKSAGEIRLSHFPCEYSSSGFLASKEVVEQHLAPSALLAAVLKPFISALIRPALDVAKRDLLVVTSTNASANTRKGSRPARTKKVPFVLTPSHILRGLQSGFIPPQAGADAQDSRGTTTQQALALCFARVGLPHGFGHQRSLGGESPDIEPVTEATPIKEEPH